MTDYSKIKRAIREANRLTDAEIDTLIDQLKTKLSYNR